MLNDCINSGFKSVNFCEYFDFCTFFVFNLYTAAWYSRCLILLTVKHSCIYIYIYICFVVFVPTIIEYSSIYILQYASYWYQQLKDISAVSSVRLFLGTSSSFAVCYNTFQTCYVYGTYRYVQIAVADGIWALLVDARGWTKMVW